MDNITDILFKESKEPTAELQKIIDTLSIQQQAQVTTHQQCFEKHTISSHIYGICWFRAFIGPFIYCSAVRKKFMNLTVNAHKEFFEFMKSVMLYIDRLPHPGDNIVDTSYAYINTSNFDISYLYMMYLLNQINNELFSNMNHESGGQTTAYFRNFVNIILPQVLPNSFKCEYFRIDDSAKLVTEIIQSKTEQSDGEYQCLFIEYSKGTCPLYIKYKKINYSLQSSYLRSIMIDKETYGHSFSYFRCGDRYFSPDCERKINECFYRSFGDINLIESLLNDGELKAVNETKISKNSNYKYNPLVSYYSTIGIYMPIELEFLPYEIQLLEMFTIYIKQTTLDLYHFQNLISIVSHFFSSFLITIKTLNKTLKPICFFRNNSNKVTPETQANEYIITEETYPRDIDSCTNMKEFFKKKRTISVDGKIKEILYSKESFVSKTQKHEKVLLNLLNLIPASGGRRILRMKSPIY